MAVTTAVSPNIDTDADTDVTGLVAGAEVLTIEGLMPVEFLEPGDRIVTRGGVRRLAELKRGTYSGPRLCGDGRQPRPHAAGPRYDADAAHAGSGPRLARAGDVRLRDRACRGRGAGGRIVRQGSDGARRAAVHAGVRGPAGHLRGRHGACGRRSGTGRGRTPKAPASRNTFGNSSGRSSAISPGPKLNAHST